MIYEWIVRPVLFRFDPEFVHDMTVLAGRIGGSNPITRAIIRTAFSYSNPALEQEVCGVRFPNPIGLAAGFDKDCKLMHVLPDVGFGYEEVGSITAEPYEGNPNPRLTRLPEDKSIIVYYGLKNCGARVLRERLKGKHCIPIGVSVAKTNKDFKTLNAKIADWKEGVQLLKERGDYITINVSCPNTFDPENFNDPKLLNQLLKGIGELKTRKPIFIKLSADLTTEQLDSIIDVCDRYSFVKGLIIANLVKDRKKLKLKSPKHMYEGRKGGLSGKIVKPYALKMVRHAYERAGDRYVIIGCGGIFTAEDAYEFIRNGATLLQLITGMIYGGPATIKRINKGLVRLLERDGYTSISEAVGAATSRQRRL
jgi:dihydroorotate dehydrogenase